MGKLRGGVAQLVSRLLTFPIILCLNLGAYFKIVIVKFEKWAC
jgi:hypothetical protein